MSSRTVQHASLLLSGTSITQMREGDQLIDVVVRASSVTYAPARPHCWTSMCGRRAASTCSLAQIVSHDELEDGLIKSNPLPTVIVCELIFVTRSRPRLSRRRLAA